MVGISWQIVLAIAGVISGFFVTEKVLERMGYRKKEEYVSVDLEELPKYLRDRFLVDVALVRPDGSVFLGVSESEVKEIEEKFEENEVILISGNNYTYMVKRGDVIVFVRGKFLSMKDFSDLWMTVRRSLGGVRR